MKNIIFALLLLLVFVSCNPQNDFNRGYIIDKDTEFGDVITLVRENTTFYRYTGKNNEKQILQSGVVVKYHSLDGVVDTVKLWGGSKVISSHVNKICSDDLFILVDQKPLDSIFGKYETRLKDDGSMYGRSFMPLIYSMKRRNCGKAIFIVIGLLISKRMMFMGQCGNMSMRKSERN